jgi:hypothetical protein
VKSPKAATYCVQLVTSVGSCRGPLGASPTKAATDVPTPSMGRVPLATSST